MLTALKKFGEDSFEYQKALGLYEISLRDYDSTPKGIQALEEAAQENPSDDLVLKRLKLAKRIRQSQIDAVKEIKNGRQENIKNIYLKQQTFFNDEEMLSIVESVREHQESKLLHYPNFGNKPVSDEEYQNYLNTVEQNMERHYSSIKQIVPEDQKTSLDNLRQMETPDRLNFEAYKDLVDKVDTAKKHLDNELIKSAALQDVSPRIAASFYDAYREQYQMVYANLPETERPDPPEKWVRGEFSASGYAKDFNSEFAPHDPASLYAIYRLRSDPDAIPDYLKTSRVMASVDLETAGPHGGAGFKPENGRIIEVGIITYSKSGKELTRYSQLIKPEQKFIDEHGTGSEDIHHISVKDLENSPSWGKVSPTVLGLLENKTLLAQNAFFERRWLKHHADEKLISSLPVIDTLEMGRKYLDLPNYQLETICHELKIPYKNGHRALHDADVTAQAYFSMQRNLKKSWKAKPARKNAPAIEAVNPSRWGK